MRKSSKVAVADSSVTIKDIAEYLGISHSTVSRALGDHPYTNAHTKQRVREAVEKLGYVPNAAARSMRGDLGSIVGLILPDIYNELFGATAQIVSHRCSKSGFQMVLAVSEDDPLTEYKHVLALREARAAGIIITPTPGLLDKTRALLQSVPVVQYSRRHPQLASPSISVDGERGIRVATLHLLQLGHRRIGYIGMTTDKSTGAERLGGYTAAHKQAGVRSDPALIRLGASHSDFARAAASELLQLPDPPTALLLGSNPMTVGALRALRQANLKVPADMSLICFGDSSWYTVWDQGITTIGSPFQQMADAVASELMRQLTPGANVAEGRATHLAFEPTFLVRETTAPLRHSRDSKRQKRGTRKTG
jgi:DNA-binding LacI/PurR family transcriptional regulator